MYLCLAMGRKGFILVIWIAVLGVSSAKIGGWDTAPNTQYHIQTDEGPERYFKYQTISGQYRKEKRLQDGTVVGTYGWVDPNGYLRLRDYIADDKGYRIVRTKKVLVGVETPISNAVSIAKKVPSQGGVGVENAKLKPTTYKPEVETNSVNYPTTYRPEIEINSVNYPTTYSPEVNINSVNYPTTTIRPISLSDHLKETYPSSTPSPYSLRQPIVVISPNSYHSTPAPYFEPPHREVIQPQTFRPYYNPNAIQNYYDNRRIYDNIGAGKYDSGSSQQFPLYDGVSMTHNGFRYYLPRHYHEEENLPGEKRAGSFGYIDPFGIRRVIYYNADPASGFVHRKNNRYVGFNATPYDPRFK